MERVSGVEPPSRVWKTRALTAVLHPPLSRLAGLRRADPQEIREGEMRRLRFTSFS